MKSDRTCGIRVIPTPAPSSGFYPVAPRAKALGPTEGPPPEEPRRYAEGLLRTGDLFLCADGLPLALDSLLAAIEATVPIRALVLVDLCGGEVRARTTHAAGLIESADLDRIEGDARAVFAYLAELSETLGGHPMPGVEIALPLVAEDGAVFAVLLACVAATASEGDLAFLDAVAAQFARALAHERSAAAERLARERAASELAVERAAHEVTRSKTLRASFLAEALAILNTTPDPARDLARLARLVSHRVADGCVFELGVLGALQRTAATHLPDAVIERAVARLVPRTFVVRRTLAASAAPWPGDTLAESGWQMDAGAEDLRQELAIEWLVCAPVAAADAVVQGALLLFGDATGAPVDPPTVDLLARVLGDALERARPYRAALRAMEDRDRVLSTVAHDLRQPLNAILLNVTALVGRFPPEQDRRRLGRKQLDLVTRSVHRLARLTQDLLDVSSIDARTVRLDCARVSLPALIAEASELVGAVAKQRGVELRVHAPSRLPVVWADATRVHQVLLNLIGNAIKFTPPGGMVTLEARAVDGAVAVAVRDTGPGIPECDRALVFERFWQAKSTAALGAGIGLTITKAIVEAHGGRIEVDGARGAGATFTFTLPIAS